MNTKKVSLIFFIIITIQICFITYLFAFKKDNFHVDEIWQYSLSNAADGYGILRESTRSLDLRNSDVWLTKDKFIELLTVQKGELFDMKHIWDNARMDTKGPLGNVPLFFISSLSLNHFSKWQMYVVNVISFVLIQIFLFKTSYLISRNKVLSFLVITFYGFVQAGINTVLFLRMYALEAAVTMMFIYAICHLYIKVCRENVYKVNKLKFVFLAIFFTILCGTLIDYIFMIIAFFSTAVLCVIFLFKKHYKILLIYMGVSILAIVAFVLVFPGAFDHFKDLGTSRMSWGKALSIPFSLTIYCSIILYDFLGVIMTIYKTMVPLYMIWALIVLMIIYIVIRFLFRKEIDSKALRNKIRSFFYNFVNVFNGRGLFYIVFLIALFSDMIFTAMNINILAMGMASNRYLMPVYPLMTFLIIDIVYVLWTSFVNTYYQGKDIGAKHKNKNLGIIISFFLVLCLSVRSWNLGDITFLSKYSKDVQVDLDEILYDNDAIFVCDTEGDPVILTQKSLDINVAYFTSVDTFQQFDQNDRRDVKNKLYLVIAQKELKEYKRNFLGIIDSNGEDYDVSEKNILNHFQDIYNDCNVQFLGEAVLRDTKANVYEILPYDV